MTTLFKRSISASLLLGFAAAAAPTHLAGRTDPGDAAAMLAACVLNALAASTRVGRDLLEALTLMFNPEALALKAKAARRSRT